MYTKVELGFDMDSLEPLMTRETINIHYNKHHQTYLDKLNTFVSENQKDLFNHSLEHILTNLNLVNEEIKLPVYNNGFQVLNHNLFWESIRPNGGEVSEELLLQINKDFSSLDEFKALFNKLSINHFGSGWVFLSVDENGNLKVKSYNNADSPLSENCTPLMVIDVWEHAYYLKHQNRRPEYIENFWKLLNWTEVNTKYIKYLNEVSN